MILNFLNVWSEQEAVNEIISLVINSIKSQNIAGK